MHMSESARKAPATRAGYKSRIHGPVIRPARAGSLTADWGAARVGGGLGGGGGGVLAGGLGGGLGAALGRLRGAGRLLRGAQRGAQALVLVPQGGGGGRVQGLAQLRAARGGGARGWGVTAAITSLQTRNCGIWRQVRRWR